MDYLAQYGLFLGETITVALAIIFTLVACAAVSKKGGASDTSLEITNLSEDFIETRNNFQRELLGDKAFKKWLASEREHEDKVEKSNMFVIDFNGDTHASQVDNLREEITAVLSVATPDDEILVRIESPGGVVHGYGLAASQLDRIKRKGIPLTVSADKIAASGGYMMACVADKIIAAPFSIIGSVGVIAMFPNFSKLIKKLDVDWETFTAGEFKRTVDMVSEISPEGRKKFSDDLVAIYEQFKSHITKYRPSLNVNQIATGEVWSGDQALSKGLVDSIQTSDEYIIDAIGERNVFLIELKTKKKFFERLGLFAEGAIKRMASSLSNELTRPR